ncbi:MAG: hypothetical protein OXR73_10640 [Myxococcales bacterium]|nr:hypothetical protein [Myxococcales bacterium]
MSLPGRDVLDAAVAALMAAAALAGCAPAGSESDSAGASGPTAAKTVQGMRVISSDHPDPTPGKTLMASAAPMSSAVPMSVTTPGTAAAGVGTPHGDADDQPDSGSQPPNNAEGMPKDPSPPPAEEENAEAVEPDAGLAELPPVSVDPDTDIRLGTGSCCAVHDTPGCSNADLQVCVCERLPACCTEAWSEACALVVQHKHCQPGVRACVCGMEDGQWGQATCCEDAWTDGFCDQIATDKCGAEPGCR